mmetsp:Transcript_34502/g.53869  ORF Transcript_34502/g.53869 Transcript_34502/m.53869 type:complete len:193 (-) Transcript_34502:177-755(-)
MNRLLPFDVKITDLEEAPELVELENLGKKGRWHAIFSSKNKIYSYRLFFGKVLDPLNRHLRHHEYRECDVDRFKVAAQLFVGEHNFAAFANQNQKGWAAVNPVRTVNAIDVIDEGNDNFKVTVNLDGALYKMVRNMVGAMLAVGCGKMQPGDISEMLQTGQRTKTYNPAPANGLCLERVFYSDYLLDMQAES